MNLYFVRHGIAENRLTWHQDDASGDDALRPLTDKGIVQMGWEAEAIADLVRDLDVIITSPLVRARQTAEIIARKLAKEDNLIEDPRLSPGFGLEELAEIVKEQAGAEGIILVGHEPDFSETMSDLIGGGRLVCKKGSLARVDLISTEPPSGELVWLIPPKALIR